MINFTNMNRGEIWWINLNPTIGQEIQKTRPCVIVSDDNIGILPLRVVVPLTDWKDRYSSAEWMVRIEKDDDNQISKTSAVDCFQVRSLSVDRFVEKVGVLSNETMTQIEKALAIVLKIE